MKKLDYSGRSDAALNPAYLFEKDDKAYHVDLVKWDDRVVGGNIRKVQVLNIERTTNFNVQWVTVREIESNREQSYRIYTTNYRLFMTKQEAKEYLYKLLLESKSHFQDLLAMIQECIDDLDVDDEIVDRTEVSMT